MTGHLPRVGVLVVAHAPLASALYSATTHIVGTPPVHMATLDIRADDSPETSRAQITANLARLDHGRGVLVLVDMIGASPANAARAALAGQQALCVVGADLSVLVRLYNYADASLAELAEMAVSTRQRHAEILAPYDAADRTV